MTELTLLILVACMLLVILAVVAVMVKKELVKYVSIMCGTATDKAVDEFFRKAIIIAVDSYKEKNHSEEEFHKLVIERASGIVSDVLLQHGLSPQGYNLAGLCKVQLYRMGFARYKSGVIKNG